MGGQEKPPTRRYGRMAKPGNKVLIRAGMACSHTPCCTYVTEPLNEVGQQTSGPTGSAVLSSGTSVVPL